MKRITLAGLTAGFLALACFPAAARAAEPVPALTVTGTGTIVRSPDQAVVSLDISTNDDVAARAGAANNAAFARLTAALRALGLPDAAVRTTGYNLNYLPRPERALPPQPYPPRYGYTVDRRISVTTDRTDQAGAIVDAAVHAGVTSVGAVSFGVRDERAARRAALAAAVADAQAQAQALAEAAHVRLGHILSISPQGGIAVPRPMFAARMAAPEGAPAPTEIAPGDLTVSAGVTISWALAP